MYRAINADLKGVYNISQTDDYPVSENKEVLKELKELGKTFEDRNKFAIETV